MYMGVLSTWMSVYHVSAWYLQGQIRVWEPLGLKLQTIVSHHVGAENQSNLGFLEK